MSKTSFIDGKKVLTKDEIIKIVKENNIELLNLNSATSTEQ